MACAPLDHRAATPAALFCAARPDYEVQVFEPHRDVLAVLVRLSERLEASEYRELASRELPSVLSAREASAVPLYEVCVEFIVRRDPSGDDELAARLTWRDETGAEPSEHSLSHAPLEIH